MDSLLIVVKIKTGNLWEEIVSLLLCLFIRHYALVLLVHLPCRLQTAKTFLQAFELFVLLVSGIPGSSFRNLIGLFVLRIEFIAETFPCRLIQAIVAFPSLISKCLRYLAAFKLVLAVLILVVPVLQLCLQVIIRIVVGSFVKIRIEHSRLCFYPRFTLSCLG